MIQVHHFPPNPTIADFSAQRKKQTIVALLPSHDLYPRSNLGILLSNIFFFFPKIWHNNF
jgi:hypothetical protein